MIALLLLLTIGDAEVGLSLAELPEYRASLSRAIETAPRNVAFHDLWDRPDEFRGRSVSVEGRVVRTFRAGASGELPARLETWLATPAGDLICTVAPDRNTLPALGDTAEFEGTSLGRITYLSGDVRRVAPLVVGPGPPRVVATTGTSAGRVRGDWLDWMIAGAAGAVVVLWIARMHLRRPPPKRPTPEVPPQFLDGPAETEGG